MLQTFLASPDAAPALAQGIRAAVGAPPRRRLTAAQRAARIEDLEWRLEQAERRIRCVPGAITAGRLQWLADQAEAYGRRGVDASDRAYAVERHGGGDYEDRALAEAAVEVGMLRRALARAGG